MLTSSLAVAPSRWCRRRSGAEPLDASDQPEGRRDANGVASRRVRPPQQPSRQGHTPVACIQPPRCPTKTRHDANKQQMLNFYAKIERQQCRQASAFGLQSPGVLPRSQGCATAQREAAPPKVPRPSGLVRRVAIRLSQRRIQPAHVISWSPWRRAHQAAAQRSHLKRKLQP
jgi:hypothetical protein